MAPASSSTRGLNRQVTLDPDTERMTAAVEIERTFATLFEPGSVTEIRAFNSRHNTISGYFDNLHSFTQAASTLASRDDIEGAYVTMNPCNAALLARAENRLKDYAKVLTSDRDIVSRRLMLIDLDPIRPANISATEEEKALAMQRARDLWVFLRSRGWPQGSLVAADSGNGAHILVRVGLPSKTDLVKRVLQALEIWFSDEKVKVDTSVSNPARIIKLYGTYARKGDNTATRPHRMAKLLLVPENIEICPTEQLEALAAKAPEPPRSDHYRTDEIKLLEWLGKYGLSVKREKPFSDGTLYELRECPFNAEHNRGEAYAAQYINGALAAGCQHDSCTWQWRELRERFEPGCYNRHHGNGYDKGAHRNSVDPKSQTNQDEGQSQGLTGLVTAKALLAEPDEETDYLVDDMLPLGGLSCHVGKPKAGKSTELQDLCRCVAKGENFLGRITKSGPVIYLALEEKRGELRKKIRAMELEDCENFHFFIERAPEDALPRLRVTMKELKPILVVIDPIFRFTRVKDANDYATITNALEPILELARVTGAHVAISHHSGKGHAREAIDSALGSTAIAGAVDTLAVLRRTDQYRTMATVQRYGADLEETVLELDEESRRLTLQETKNDAEIERIEGLILGFLETQESEVTETRINEAVEAHSSLRKKALRSLIQKEKVKRTGEGKKGKPYLYKFWVSGFLDNSKTQKPTFFNHPEEGQSDFGWEADPDVL